MMKLPRYCISGLAVLALGACDREFDYAEPDILNSSVRYVNAIPDTNRVNVRFVDFVEGNTTIDRMSLRDSSGQYTQTHDGSRRFNVFRYDTVPGAAQIKLIDTTFALNVGSTNTVWLAGFARTGQTPGMRAVVTEDNPPTPPAANFAARASNIAAGQGNLDFYVYRGALDITTGPTWPNVGFAEFTSYMNFAIAADYSVRVCPAGALNSAATCVTRALVGGTAGTTTGNTQDPIPGTNIAGSVFTFAVIPPRVAGSQALPTTATTMFIKSMVDRRPARTGP